MQCNIGERKSSQIEIGNYGRNWLLMLTGLILAGVFSGTFWWFAAGCVAFGGAFSIWEARAGGALFEQLVSKHHCEIYSHSIVPGGLWVIS